MQSGDEAVAWNAKYSPWEFVHCGVCYLPFINPRNPEAPPPVPFWLTECSHVVCNNHLNADQTCRQCADGLHIELMPLQLDLPEPMSKWFQPLPDALGDLVGASKFQHETMASLVRFYKGKCLGQKELIERLRREVETLKAEASQMRHDGQFMGGSGNPGSDPGYDFVNENGKRRRFEGVRQGSFAVDSRQRHSPSSAEPAYGSSRLTLRPGSSRAEQEQGHSYLSNSSGERLIRKQGGRSSPISLDEFAYQPVDHENERGGTARASMGTFNVAGSKGSLTVRSPAAAANDFSAGPSQLNASSHSMHKPSSRNEIFKAPVQMLNRQVDGFTNPQTANRQRFQAIPPATPIAGRSINTSNSGPGRMAPVLNPTKPSGSAMASGSRRFVPPTPIRQTSNQVPVRGAQQQRTQSQSQMPPPPLPGNPRFR